MAVALVVMKIIKSIQLHKMRGIGDLSLKSVLLLVLSTSWFIIIFLNHIQIYFYCIVHITHFVPILLELGIEMAL